MTTTWTTMPLPHQAIFDGNPREYDIAPGCFAAGTLVHTINGLVPIEQIKVGKMVLFKSENGVEQSYKTVTQTFAHDFEEVMALQVGICAEQHDIYELKWRISTPITWMR